MILDAPQHAQLFAQRIIARVMSTGEVTPLGSDHATRHDLRIILMINRDPWQEVAVGNLLGDLLHLARHRIVSVPPLRERPQDVPIIVRRLLTSDQSLKGCNVTSDAVKLLQSLPLYGNVRDLLTFLRMAGRRGPRIDASALQRVLDRLGDRRWGTGPLKPIKLRADEDEDDPGGPRLVDRRDVCRALEAAGFNQAAAARHLGLPPHKLRTWMGYWELTEPCRKARALVNTGCPVPPSWADAPEG